MLDSADVEQVPTLHGTVLVPAVEEATAFLLGGGFLEPELLLEFHDHPWSAAAQDHDVGVDAEVLQVEPAVHREPAPLLAEVLPEAVHEAAELHPDLRLQVGL